MCLQFARSACSSQRLELLTTHGGAEQVRDGHRAVARGERPRDKIVLRGGPHSAIDKQKNIPLQRAGLSEDGILEFDSDSTN